MIDIELRASLTRIQGSNGSCIVKVATIISQTIHEEIVIESIRRHLQDIMRVIAGSSLLNWSAIHPYSSACPIQRSLQCRVLSVVLGHAPQLLRRNAANGVAVRKWENGQKKKTKVERECEDFGHLHGGGERTVVKPDGYNSVRQESVPGECNCFEWNLSWICFWLMVMAEMSRSLCAEVHACLETVWKWHTDGCKSFIVDAWTAAAVYTRWAVRSSTARHWTENTVHTWHNIVFKKNKNTENEVKTQPFDPLQLMIERLTATKLQLQFARQEIYIRIRMPLSVRRDVNNLLPDVSTISRIMICLFFFFLNNYIKK